MNSRPSLPPRQWGREDAVRSVSSKKFKAATAAVAVVALVLEVSHWLGAGTRSLQVQTPAGARPASASAFNPQQRPPAPPSLRLAALKPPAPGPPRRSRLPKVLSDRDAALYRNVFELQEEGRWSEADASIERIHDPLLMGHVRFQRYMHPTRYRSSYPELRDWLRDYADHPGARRIYRLAKRRQPKGWRPPRRPVSPRPASEIGLARHPAAPQPRPMDPREAVRKAAGHSDAERSQIREVRRQIRQWLASGYAARALRFLDRPRNVRLMDPLSYDETLAQIAAGYFLWDNDRKALHVANRAVARSGRLVPLARWWGGLAAWRLGEHREAARHFHALAESEWMTPWLVSAGAYWASRAYGKAGQPERVEPMLRAASRHPRTFYGLLAIAALGERPPLDFDMPRLDRDNVDVLLRMEPARRALGLIQAGRFVTAGSELRRFVHHLPPRLARMMLALASESGLANLSLRTAERLQQSTGKSLDAALYPLPVWKPDGGRLLDRALLFSVVRQESAFQADARSSHGALGLMQIVPGTASAMAGRRYRGADRPDLMDPVLNLTLGQRYLRHLLSKDGIDGNLIYALVAYNRGPGRLREWRRKVDYRDDPLLFIESIPVRETRVFIERVLTNLWIYRARLGQPARSLETVASGGWPAYVPLDRASRPMETARPGSGAPERRPG